MPPKDSKMALWATSILNIEVIGNLNLLLGECLLFKDGRLYSLRPAGDLRRIGKPFIMYKFLFAT